MEKILVIENEKKEYYLVRTENYKTFRGENNLYKKTITLSKLYQRLEQKKEDIYGGTRHIEVGNKEYPIKYFLHTPTMNHLVQEKSRQDKLRLEQVGKAKASGLYGKVKYQGTKKEILY